MTPLAAEHSHIRRQVYAKYTICTLLTETTKQGNKITLNRNNGNYIEGSIPQSHKTILNDYISTI